MTRPLHIIFSSFEGIRLVDREVKVPDAIPQAMNGSRWQLHFTVIVDDEGKLMVTTAWYLRDDATIYEIADQLPSTQRSQNSRDQSEAGGKAGRESHSNDLGKNDEAPRLDPSAHSQKRSKQQETLPKASATEAPARTRKWKFWKAHDQWKRNIQDTHRLRIPTACLTFHMKAHPV